MDIITLNKRLFTALKLLIYDYLLAEAKRKALRYTQLTGQRAAVILTERRWLFRLRLLPLAVRLDAIPSHARSKVIRKALFLTSPSFAPQLCTSLK
ncbi:hypothetical protein [Porphyromonas catoniae]|uniref:Uncharacterized protein n=1 Tax=Porphyromonas catoniae ATCC 51270 TaxID=887901 RepID=Z4WZI1_9PORP|nr:hypothetical protein [Porphyromonas catoniae]EWC93165.1 hypothetical protein HMPREF0636_1093 [Porphyromonas catoniae ATCC 51270]DAV05710.1 MAG TPA: hypothetical protein [Caudoviricetes sp.]